MSILDCSPVVKGGVKQQTEDDLFFEDPALFVHDHYGTEDDLPSHLVLFDSVFHPLKSFLSQKGFAISSCHFHSYVASHRTATQDNDGNLLVFSRTQSSPNPSCKSWHL